MKRNELLKLPAGEYLLTDEICNFKYRLIKFDRDDSLVCFIYDYHTGIIPYGPCMALSYSQYIFSGNDYSTCKRRLECSVFIGGISIREHFSKLHQVKMIGKYNKNAIKQDFERFKMHYKISCSRCYKNRIVG
ncbi:hypothetical protein [Elizabethkingia bruuniana]|uniref:hypothetical protein n=1 Tax=Elizabethkingia bruuniana TaxID=1756149 RepID=UPI00099A3B58|nr:hypothetical protein [Elizabethkingia bruuniana]OPC53464.1 hypothetical protein BAY07_15550 [Elizabethkingia bruuniana]